MITVLRPVKGKERKYRRMAVVPVTAMAGSWETKVVMIVEGKRQITT